MRLCADTMAYGTDYSTDQLTIVDLTSNLTTGYVDNKWVSPCDDEAREEVFQTSQDPLFVSLGSTCEPAHMLRYCELRKFAFPFDWIVSFDGEALIEMLRNDFKNFLKDEYFVPYGLAGHLLNTYYHLEFLHEGDFNQEFDENLEKLKHKYVRRIDRFKSLKYYRGKVFFIRYAYLYSTTDPNRFYKFEDNLEISKEYALRLHRSLKCIFPNLDFELIIINRSESDRFQEQEKAGIHVRMFTVYPNLELSKKIENYTDFFHTLINGDEAVKKNCVN